MTGLSLRDRERGSDIRRDPEVEPLLLCVERSQLRCFGHLIMSPGHLPLEVFWGHANGGRTLEVLCISSGLGTHQDSQGVSGKCGWGESSLDYLVELVVATTLQILPALFTFVNLPPLRLWLTHTKLYYMSL